MAAIIVRKFTNSQMPHLWLHKQIWALIILLKTDRFDRNMFPFISDTQPVVEKKLAVIISFGSR